MAARPSWGGHLRLSLVSCPVSLFPATTAAHDVHFHFINPATGNRIRTRTFDADGDEVERSDLVRGYEIEKDEYILLTDEEIKSVRLESTKTIDIERFVDAADIDRIFWDNPYYLVPDGKAGLDAFVVIRSAMEQAAKVALARVVIGTRERIVAIEPRGAGMLVTTLRTRDEVREADGYFEDVPARKPDAGMIDIAQRIIAQKAGPFDPSEFKDRYEDALRALIESKRDGDGGGTKAPAPREDNVIDLMEALRRSLEGSAPRAPAGWRPRRSRRRKPSRLRKPRRRRRRSLPRGPRRASVPRRSDAGDGQPAALPRQAGFRADGRTAGRGGADGCAARLRRAAPRRTAAALRPAPGMGRRAEILGRHARPLPRSRRPAAGGGGRGPSAGLCRFRGQHPEAGVWRRHRAGLRPRAVGAAGHRAGGPGPGQGRAEIRAGRRKAEGRLRAGPDEAARRQARRAQQLAADQGEGQHGGARQGRCGAAGGNLRHQRADAGADRAGRRGAAGQGGAEAQPEDQPEDQPAALPGAAALPPGGHAAARRGMAARVEDRWLPPAAAERGRRGNAAYPHRPRLDRPLPGHRHGRRGAARRHHRRRGAALGEDGHPDFPTLQAVLSGTSGAKLVFYAFDLLHDGSRDLRGETLEARKQALRRRLPARDPVLRFLEHFPAPGDAVLASACRLSMEGIVSKRRDAPYLAGRGETWTKAKCRGRDEFVVGGFTRGQRGNGLGALLAGAWRGGKLAYLGRIGTGFSADPAAELLRRLAGLQRRNSPFTGPQPAKLGDVVWAEPELVVEVAHGGWTDDGLMRHASFQGLREDKPAEEVTPPQEPAPPPRKARTAGRAKPPLGMSNPDRVLWPATTATPAITKADLAAYYARHADRILDQVAGRPLSLLRAPDGIAGGLFFQRHAMPGQSPLIRAVQVEGQPKPFMRVDDAAGLAALAQVSAVELHPWGAQADAPEVPDRLVFDLDPDEGVPFARVIAGALELRDRLAALGLSPFARVTGGKGLHVVVKLAPPGRAGGAGWPEAKGFARLVCALMEREAPKAYTTNMAKKARKGRIFLDYLRNDRLSTAIASWSPRGRPGAPVARPVAWSAVKPGLDPAGWTLGALSQGRMSPDAWAGFRRIRRQPARRDREADPQGRGMTQLFPPRADRRLRGLLFIAGAALLLAATAAFAWSRSDGAWRVGEPAPQPIPFSHAIHAGQIGLDCRYCHAGVEHAADAGMRRRRPASAATARSGTWARNSRRWRRRCGSARRSPGPPCTGCRSMSASPMPPISAPASPAPPATARCRRCRGR
jgi:bifunctional non-homologous end joining protein LigD